MIRKTQIFLKQLVAILDGCTVAGAFVLAYAARDRVHEFYRANLVPSDEVLGGLAPFASYVGLLLFIVPCWLVTIHAQGGYRSLRTRTIRAIIRKLLKAQLIGLVGLSCFVFLLKLHYVSRTWLAVFAVLSAAALLAERVLIIWAFRAIARRGYFRHRVLMVGTGARARRLMHVVRDHAAGSVEVIGWVDQSADAVGKRVDDLPIVGTLEQLPDLMTRLVVDEVVFAVPRSWLSHLEDAILQCELLGIKTTVATDLYNLRFAKASTIELEGIPLLTFDATPHEQWALAFKRVADLIIAAVGLIAALPVLVAAAVAIKVTSPGPIFFRQQRVGLNGRVFTFYKFRTMVNDAEQRRIELAELNEMDGPVFKMANDPRLTTVGRWLRRLSIDEIPQLWNVFRGEMSLVGPRPPLPNEVVQYEPWQRRRLSMRPGLTCLWQVNGRNHIPFQRWMELDLQYIDRWSLGLDVKILLKTVPAVLSGSGAK